MENPEMVIRILAVMKSNIQWVLILFSNLPEKGSFKTKNNGFTENPCIK